MFFWMNVVLSFVFAGLRAYGVTHEAYQSVVHIYMGYLGTIWYTYRGGPTSRFAKTLFWTLVAVELTAVGIKFGPQIVNHLWVH